MSRSRFVFRSPVLGLSLLFAACGEDHPPSAETQKAVTVAVVGFESGGWGNLGLAQDGAEVRDVEIGAWTESEFSTMQRKATERMGGDAGDVPIAWSTTWKAKLVLREPVVLIDHELRGKNIVRVIAEAGASLAFTGKVLGTLLPSSGWDIDASVDGADMMGNGGPLQPWHAVAGDVRQGYPVIGNPNMQVRMRSGPRYASQSLLPDALVLGSPEHQRLAAEQQKEDEARVAQQLRAQEQRRQQQLEQQQAMEAAAKKRVEDAERARAEQLEKARRAAAAPRLAPFAAAAAAGHGVMLAVAGSTLRGFVFAEVAYDADKLEARGKGVDLRTLPVRDVAFATAVDAQGNVALTIDGEAKPVALGNATRDVVACSGGLQLFALAEGAARDLAAVVAAAKRDQAGTPAVLTATVLDAAAATERGTSGAPVPMAGDVLHNDRAFPGYAPLFAPAPDLKVEHRVNTKPIVLRLAAPVRGAGLLLRGGARGTVATTLVLNGVHRVEVPAIAAAGAAFLAFPENLELFDVRLEAKGDTRLRGIQLLTK
jgi:hypothetical protein